MANIKSQKRDFNGMSYGELQSANSQNRSKLNKEDQRWLRDNGYRNTGWNNVIALYQKIEEFIDKHNFESMSLEDLFLEADRIGNKYLTSEEIQEFNKKISQEAAEIGDLIDKQFPDTNIEVLDFYQKDNKEAPEKHNQKTYRTIKL